MISEGEYVLELFKNNFENIKNKRIALYGTGYYTEIILKNFTGYNFIGIMDGFRTDGSFENYDILDTSEVLKRNVEIIIIVARANNTKVIYNRISEFCENNKIKVMDIYGNDLGVKKVSQDISDPYFKKNESELKNLIDLHDAISFDVFDTLIMRHTLIPEDVFEIMAEKLKKDSFPEFRKRSVKKPNFNIYEIYDEYQKITEISDTEKKALIDMEIEIERSVLTPREKMVEIFNYAVNTGKKVYLISDMYLTEEILTTILNDMNIFGYEKIFVSCEYDSLKSQGLYKKYKEAVKADSYLHIGDSEDSDGKYAQMNGISVYLIKSAYDLLDISAYKEIMRMAKTLADRCMLGLFTEKAFNNPFCMYGATNKLTVKSAYDRGYLFIAPLITCFMFWLIKKLQEDTFDTVLFAARDGYLISGLYDISKNILKCDLPEGKYFLTSRFAAGMAVADNEEIINYLASYAYIGNVEEMMQKRFALFSKDVMKYNNDESFQDYVKRHIDKILKKSYEMKQNYLKYANKIGVLDKRKIAFFDFVSSGTTQMCVNNLLNAETKGFYFIHIISNYERKRKLDIKSLYKPGNAFEMKSNVFENYLFLEYILPSSSPTLYCFNENGEPEFIDDYRTVDDINDICIIQNAIMEYYTFFLKKFSVFHDISLEFVDKLFGFMEPEYSDICDEFSKELILKGEFSNKNLLINKE